MGKVTPFYLKKSYQLRGYLVLKRVKTGLKHSEKHYGRVQSDLTNVSSKLRKRLQNPELVLSIEI